MRRAVPAALLALLVLAAWELLVRLFGVPADQAECGRTDGEAIGWNVRTALECQCGRECRLLWAGDAVEACEGGA